MKWLTIVAIAVFLNIGNLWARGCSSSIKALTIKSWTAFNKLPAVVRIPAAVTFVPVMASLLTRAGYEAHALVQGKEHIGQGIYMERDYFDENVFSQKQIQDPKENADNMALTLMAHLDEGFEQAVARKVDWWPASRDAQEFFDGHPSGAPGVCRNKACLLAGVLRDYGIQVNLYSAIEIPGYSKSQGHVFVVLPKEGKPESEWPVYDPVHRVYGDALGEVLKKDFFNDMIIVNHSRGGGVVPGFYYWVVDGLAR